MSQQFLITRTCVACLRLLVKTHYHCPVYNHNLCFVCHHKYLNCPSCNTKRKKRTKIICAESRYPDTLYHCENLPFGCTSMLLDIELKEHAKECRFRPFRCPCHCNDSVSLWSIQNHFPIANLKSKRWSNTVEYTVRVGDSKRFVCRSLDNAFIIEIKVIGDNANDLLLNAVCFILRNTNDENKSTENLQCMIHIERPSCSQAVKSQFPINCVLNNDRNNYEESFFGCCENSIVKFMPGKCKSQLIIISIDH